jgi:F-box-like
LNKGNLLAHRQLRNKYMMDGNSSLEKKDILVNQLEDTREQLRRLGYADQALAGSEKLQKLAMAYNLVVEEIHMLEEKPRFDPIEYLPEEVAVTVLEHAVVKDSHGFPFISTDMVLLLTLVSSKWCRLIESTPSLWTDIILDDEREDLAMKVTISLFFSSEAYLAVQVVASPRRWSEIEAIVLPHVRRIRNLYMMVGWADNSLSISIAKQFLNPQLRSIDWSQHTNSIGREEKIFLSGQSGYLDRVTGLALTRDVLHLPYILNLKEFATHEDANRVLAESLPRLEKVAFLEKSYADKEAIGTPLTVETLGWTSLIYRQGVTKTLTSLLSRLPLLRDLSLGIEYHDLSRLIASMRNLQVLQSLSLSCWNIPDKIFVPPATIEPLLQVRTFIFKEQSMIASDVEWEKLSQVPNAFFSLIPNVEHLEIKSYINSLAFINKITSALGFRRVHTLLLDFYDSGPSPAGEFKFPESVRNLKIISRWPNGSITPGVERLQVVVLNLQNAGSQYSTVQKLHLHHFRGASINFQPFTALTDILIDGDNPVTRFCVVIATYPDTCPALHTLSCGKFPDLDILFIMLEHRNLYSHSTTARIRNLELPTRMSLSNFKTVRELLRGRIVERQSNFEASLQSNMNMFLDLNM